MFEISMGNLPPVQPPAQALQGGAVVHRAQGGEGAQQPFFLPSGAAAERAQALVGEAACVKPFPERFPPQAMNLLLLLCSHWNLQKYLLFQKP